jgi:hypothetical protein
VHTRWSGDQSRPVGRDILGTTRSLRCTFFLIELDHESLPHAVDSLLINWVGESSFPANFNLLQADSLLGDDDLLGMQSYLVSDLPRLSTLVFSGRQLFDRFVYELYFRSE